MCQGSSLPLNLLDSPIEHDPPSLPLFAFPISSDARGLNVWSHSLLRKAHCLAQKTRKEIVAKIHKCSSQCSFAHPYRIHNITWANFLMLWSLQTDYAKVRRHVEVCSSCQRRHAIVFRQSQQHFAQGGGGESLCGGSAPFRPAPDVVWGSEAAPGARRCFEPHANVSVMTGS